MSVVAAVKTAQAIALAIDLITLATEAAAAAQRVSLLLQKRQAEGTEVTDEDWATLLSERAAALALLHVSIGRRAGERPQP